VGEAIAKLERDAPRNRAEDLVPSKVCKTSLIQLSMQCIHERILSTVGEVGLEVILNIIAFFLFSPMHLKQARRIQRVDCDEVYDEGGCNDVDDGWAEECGLGCFSPMQRLDKRSEA
jgi:hypothetical protein